MNDPYMIHQNRPDAPSMTLHPGRPPRHWRAPSGRPVVPYAPSVRVTPPCPGGAGLVPPPPGTSSGGSSASSDLMADSTFDINSSDLAIRGTLATLVRRLGGTVVDTTPAEDEE